VYEGIYDYARDMHTQPEHGLDIASANELQDQNSKVLVKSQIFFEEGIIDWNELEKVDKGITTAVKALSDCCSRNHSLDVRSTMLLVRQNVGSCCT
jgi:hypothetical protein